LRVGREKLRRDWACGWPAAEGSGHRFGQAGAIRKNDDVPRTVDLGWRLLARAQGTSATNAEIAKHRTSQDVKR